MNNPRGVKVQCTVELYINRVFVFQAKHTVFMFYKQWTTKRKLKLLYHRVKLFLKYPKYIMCEIASFFPYYHWSVCNVFHVLCVLLTMFFRLFFRWVHWFFFILETTYWVRSKLHQHFTTASFCRLDHQLHSGCLKI